MIKYLKEQYLSVIIIIVLIFFTLSEQQRSNLLLKQTVTLENKILILKKRDQELNKTIDSLSRVDTLIVNRIKIIKQKEYVQIKIMDSLPVSELQNFFTDRYKEE